MLHLVEMSEILQANIFFLIASIATVVFSLFVCFILYQIIKIIRLVKSILERIEEGSEVLAGDLTQIRMFFSEGSVLTKVLTFFAGRKVAKMARRKVKEVVGEDEE